MSTATRQLDPNRLTNLLAQQRDLYRRLRELSDKQRALIAGDRPEMLLSVLRDRQDLVTALARLNDELSPFRRNWDAMYANLPPDQRAAASTLLQEINGLLRVILKTDQEDGALLSARKQSIATDLASVTGGQMANNAYAQRGAALGSARTADVTG